MQQYTNDILFDIKIYRELHNLRKFVEENNGTPELIKLTSYLLGKKFHSLITQGIPVEDIFNIKLES